VFACNGGDERDAKPVSRVFSGDLPGTDARVGIVVSERHARIFFCGGPSSYQTKTRWLTAGIDTVHRLALPASATESWKLEGDVSGVEVNGSVEMGDAVPHSFRATLVTEGTLGGLYEGTADCGKLSLIVSQPTAAAAPVGIGACIGASSIEQVDPLMPIERGADGSIRVTVSSAGSVANPLAVRAAAPPLD
jgi:hypothetical protein